MQLTIPTPTQSKALGAEVFAFGFPLLLTTETMRQATAGGASSGPGPNSFGHVSRFPDPSFRAIVAANVDTLYSSAWLDLSLEPMLMALPDTGGRSYLLSMMDAWTGIFGSFTPRTLGGDQHTLAIAGPGWSGDLPPGAKRVDAPTNCVWAIYHLHGRGPGDLQACRAIQGRLTLTPMSADRVGGNRPQSIEASTRAPLATAYQRVMDMEAPQFLAGLAEQMGPNPPARRDGPLLEHLATINLRPGRPLKWSDIPAPTREGLTAGLEDGRKLVASEAVGDEDGSWLVDSTAGAASVDADYVSRARAASFALGVSRPTDAIFPLSTTDSAGRPLSGRHSYAISFKSSALPPVEAHWSLAVYDLDQLFVDNPLDRYALGDRDELEFDSEGTLQIAVQHDPPEGPISNWLPTPEDGFYLMLHLHEPDESVLDGTWAAPPIERIG